LLSWWLDMNSITCRVQLVQVSPSGTVTENVCTPMRPVVFGLRLSPSTAGTVGVVVAG
jgi:hypothetical protein